MNEFIMRSPKLGGPGCKVCAGYRRREQSDEDRLFKIIEKAFEDAKHRQKRCICGELLPQSDSLTGPMGWVHYCKAVR